MNLEVPLALYVGYPSVYGLKVLVANLEKKKSFSQDWKTIFPLSDAAYPLLENKRINLGP